jgi:serine/threonine-protein kinase RsbT
MSRAIPDRFGARVSVCEESDVVMARVRARRTARFVGLSETAVEELATALSEVARNITVHAFRGEIRIAVAQGTGREGVVIVATDIGPGIPDLEQAMADGYSTTNSLGLGLASARRLMDEFQINSVVGEGTTITMKKWAR